MKEYPAPPEVVNAWKNRRVYNRKGDMPGFVRGLFLRKAVFSEEIITWLVVRWPDGKVSAVSLREGNLFRRQDGHWQLAG
jgi:hypothetical protein